MHTTISQLENGLTVASAHMPDAHSVAVGVWIKAGSRDEADGLTGVAHFLEHMAFKDIHAMRHKSPARLKMSAAL